jgi:hypothetical protein
MDDRTPPHFSSPRTEPSDARRVVVALTLGLVALPAAALLALLSLGYPWVAYASAVPLGLAAYAARSALGLPPSRPGVRVGLLVLPTLTALIAGPLLLFLISTCLRGTNSCF